MSPLMEDADVVHIYDKWKSWWIKNRRSFKFINTNEGERIKNKWLRDN